MTNAMIIFNESVDLLNKGILQGTGETVKIVDDDGTEHILEMPEPIHTYEAWKKLGYKVKRGEKAIAQFPIWKYVKKKGAADDDSNDPQTIQVVKNGYCVMRLSSFFKQSQVEKIGGED